MSGQESTSPGAAGSSGATAFPGGRGSSSGGATSGDSGGISMSDAGPSDPAVAYAVTLTMNSFPVDPGQEVFKCQDFANPFNGQQADIKTYELHMSHGSHHMLAFYKPLAIDGPLIACPLGGLQFGPFSFSAQAADVTETYPEGIGATIPADTGFTLNAHYTNPGSTSLTGQVSLTMYVAKPGVVTQHAGVLFLNQLNLFVPPSATSASPFTSSAKYVLPQDVYLLRSESHMHQRAIGYQATASTGQTLYETTQWDEPPPMTYTPPLHLAAGTSITWSCTYVNDTGQPLVFGEFAQSNVMCISISTFYPVQDIRYPVVDFMR